MATSMHTLTMRGSSSEQDRGWPLPAKLVAGAGVGVAILLVGSILTLTGVSGVWRHFQLWTPVVAIAYWPLAYMALRRRYGVQRTEWEQAKQRRSGERAYRILFGYFLPLGAVVVLILFAIDVGPAVRAARGDGRPGTLWLTTQSCSHNHCDWYGDFRSDDGQLVRGHVLMHDGVPAGARSGDQFRALDAGDRSGVFAVSGSRAWMPIVLMGAVSGGYLIGWVRWVIGRRPTRRRPAEVQVPGL
jgi:hypothetical protein